MKPTHRRIRISQIPLEKVFYYWGFNNDKTLHTPIKYVKFSENRAFELTNESGDIGLFLDTDYLTILK